MKWIIELRTELALRPLANHQHFHNLIDTFLVIFDQKLVWLVILTPELAQDFYDFGQKIGRFRYTRV